MDSNIHRPEWIPSAYREEEKNDKAGGAKMGNTNPNAAPKMPTGHSSPHLKQRSQKKWRYW